jgi:glycosyltransferase involved in cell wall biosynthesis
MKILYISGENIPGDHGGSIHTWYVARGWARLGYQVTVLCRKHKGQEVHEDLEGVHIHRIPMEFQSKKMPLLGLPTLPGLLSKPWDVIVERYDVFGGLGAILARIRGIPLLLEVNYPHLDELIWKWQQRHSRFLKVPFLAKGLHWWENWQYRQAKSAIATRKEIVPEFIRDRTWLVHWGADSYKFHPLSESERTQMRQELGIVGRPVVLFMGSFRPWHGVDMLPDIIELTQKAIPEVKFLLVGDGDGRDKLQMEIHKRRLDLCVTFTGNWRHQEIPKLLSSADIGIAPYDDTKYQPLKDFGFFWSPAKLFEYAACGLPVVSTRYDLLSEIVEDGVTGRLVTPGDVEAFTKVVIDLLEHPEKRIQMGENGRRRVVDKFNWDYHAKQVSEILQNLVNEKRISR